MVWGGGNGAGVGKIHECTFPRPGPFQMPASIYLEITLFLDEMQGKKYGPFVWFWSTSHFALKVTIKNSRIWLVAVCSLVRPRDMNTRVIHRAQGVSTDGVGGGLAQEWASVATRGSSGIHSCLWAFGSCYLVLTTCTYAGEFGYLVFCVKIVDFFFKLATNSN